MIEVDGDDMLKQLKYAAAAMLLALPAVVCAQQPASPPASAPADAATASGASPAAHVGDRVITIKEVDEAWRKADPVEHTRATQLLYDGRKQALERMIADILIEKATKAKGVSAEQYAKEETAKRVKPVADADIASFYEQNKPRMQGKPLEEMRGMIRSFLEQQQQGTARAGLVAELRKAGPPVRLTIEPPRQAVAVAPTDPSRGGAKAAVLIVEFSDYQ
jgi:hypothetical protein